MRRLGRTTALVLTFGVLASTAGLAAAGPAGAAVGVTAFTIDGSGDKLAGPYAVTLTPTNATVTISPTVRGGITVHAASTDGTQVWDATVEPDGVASGLAVGHYAFDSSTGADDLAVSGDGVTCTTTSGTLDINEVVGTAGSYSSFAASYTQVCDGSSSPSYGELRYQSSQSFVAADADPLVDFGLVGQGVFEPGPTVTITDTGTAPLVLGTPTLLPSTDSPLFQLFGTSCNNVTLQPGGQCMFTLGAHNFAASLATATVEVTDNTRRGQRVFHVSIDTDFRGTYVPLYGERVLDTRPGQHTSDGLYAGIGPVRNGHPLNLPLAFRGSVPEADEVSAVVLNVTVTAASNAGYLTVYPTGSPRPLASTINFAAGQTVANLVTVKVSSGGSVTIAGSATSVQVIVDVQGQYNTGLNGFAAGVSVLHPTLPERLVDTRTWGQGPLRPHAYYYQWFDDPGVNAVALNVTAVNPTKGGFLTATGGNAGTFPLSSNLNFAAGHTVPNMVIVDLQPGTAAVNADSAGKPTFSILNGSLGSTDVVVDLVGWFDAKAGSGLVFHPVSPTRILDTRSSLGAPGPIGAGGQVTVSRPAGIGDSSTGVLALNVTATDVTKFSFLTIWPSDAARPLASNLNLVPAHNVAGMVLAALSADQKFSIYNLAGSTDAVADVSGYFDPPPATGQPFVTRADVGASAPHLAGG